jgi:protein involved in polysaccharide export with SLBB domain
MAKKKWIAGAIKRPGALTRKAKAKGMTIEQYCAQEGLSTQSKRQCNLAKTLKSFR